MAATERPAWLVFTKRPVWAAVCFPVGGVARVRHWAQGEAVGYGYNGLAEHTLHVAKGGWT